MSNENCCFPSYVCCYECEMCLDTFEIVALMDVEVWLPPQPDQKVEVEHRTCHHAERVQEEEQRP